MSKNFFDRITALVAAITAIFCVSLLLCWPLTYIWNHAMRAAFPFLGNLNTLQMLGVLFFFFIVAPVRSVPAIQILNEQYLKIKEADDRERNRGKD